MLTRFRRSPYHHRVHALLVDVQMFDSRHNTTLKPFWIEKIHMLHTDPDQLFALTLLEQRFKIFKLVRETAFITIHDAFIKLDAMQEQPKPEDREQLRSLRDTLLWYECELRQANDDVCGVYSKIQLEADKITVMFQRAFSYVF